MAIFWNVLRVVSSLDRRRAPTRAYDGNVGSASVARRRYCSIVALVHLDADLVIIDASPASA